MLQFPKKHTISNIASLWQSSKVRTGLCLTSLAVTPLSTES